MKKIISMICAVAFAALTLTSCGYKYKEGDTDISAAAAAGKIDTFTSFNMEEEPDVLFKAKKGESNPLLTNIFCADPTSVEYEGRLYVYGTRDHQQYLEKGDSDNTYEKIKSFVIISTDDMVNWRYEGMINTAEIAPWIIASWAPSVTSRVESDGKTHFYLYFSNSGAGVGVLTATHPAGPWTDPLGKPLISAGMAETAGCPNPFDPGVCIDDNGTGWLSFGGGTAAGGSKFLPGSSRIIRLGEDMISLDGTASEIPAPYFFEASELNFINGTYVYTYNNSWEQRIEWDKERYGAERPPACSMAYFTTKTPLDPDSWEYKGYYLKNPGELGMYYSNNHTHLHKFNGTYYLFYHTLLLQNEFGIDKGFRSIGADVVEVDEQNVVINVCNASKKGLTQTKAFDPYALNQAETAFLTDTDYIETDGVIAAECTDGKIISVKGADFGEGSKAFFAKVKGNGTVEVRLDRADNETVTFVSFDTNEWTSVYNEAKIEETHDIYFVFSGNFEFDEWQFAEK